MAKRTAGVRMVKRRARPAPGWLARTGILLYWLVAVTAIVFSVLLIALRLWGLPAIEAERERIVAAASEAIGVPMRIDNLRAGWQGINPRFEFFDVRIAGADGQTRLTLPRVEAVVSWLSLAVLDLRLARLQIDGPNLVIERDAGGRLSVAGIALDDSQGGESPAADWLMRQHRLVITDGELTWLDRQRNAPPLHLNDIAFRLDNLGPWHRFALRGTPPSAMASPLDLRGSLFGFDHDLEADWRGELYIDVDRVDLDAWQQWVNVPFELRSGGAGIRAWVDIARSGPVGITADLRLAGTDLRLSKSLPLLSVELLAGRVGVRRHKAGFRVDLSRLQLHTADGIHVDPVDADIAWQFEADGGSDGHVEVARIDLGTLARVAEFLPLDEGTRTLLVDYQPAGRLSNLRASWLGKAAGLEAYSLISDFEDLGVRARGRFPGIQGLSGNLEANERWGRLFLNSGPSGLELPAVFPEPLMAFDSLAGGVRWTRRDKLLEVELQALNFAGIDAVGTARGRYEYRGDGPGYLDLSAELTRAEAPAVWRYLPHVVPPGTRDWLREALRKGIVDHAELRLEGELMHFPFEQGDGTFVVNARVRNATLAFQPGWPAVESLDADLRFAGSRMEIVSRAGSILGVPLRRTVVALPNLAGFDPVLSIDGGAAGPIPSFLAFLDESPIGGAIGGFYRDWRAEGEADLKLGLSIPLARPAETSVEGSVEFRDARLKLFDFLPAVNRVRGKLAFSEKGAEARDLRGDFLGSPAKVTVASGEGNTEVRANGTLRADAAYRHYGWGWLPYLGGEAAWEARVRVPPDGRVLVDVSSDLTGLASSLKAPLNKTADEALPLRVSYQRSSAGDRLETTLGKQIAADLRGQLRGERWQIARGAVAIGEPLALPAKGFELRATMPNFDADFWQRVLRTESANGKPLAASSSQAAADAADAQAAERAAGPEAQGWPMEAWPQLSLRFVRLRYAERDFNEVLLEGRPQDARLSGRVEAKEALGTWAWRPSPSGPGQLSARLQRLAVPAVSKPEATETGVGAVVEAAVDTARAVLAAPGELVGKPAAVPPSAPPSAPAATGVLRPRLPDLDLQADDARVGAMGLGRLELMARNVGDDWLIDRFISTAADGEISASGGHYNHGDDETRLSISVTASNLGTMLDRLGYGGAVGSGSGRLGGAVRWSGGIPDYAPGRLGGDVVVHAEKGRFRSLENRGARLLGLLSLQNLPRRLLFDFGDVVSEGIAFDSIDGRFAIADGVMKTEGFRIDSPSGRVLMAGDIDLGRETQDLRLAIRPAVGSTVALGAAIFANPIVGVATLLAQKLFRDPLDKAFAVEYSVRGPWSEPQVERIGQVGGAAPGTAPVPTP
ncbi:MAG TPA: YhdP family protein [Rhodocyclaceae bacterium]